MSHGPVGDDTSAIFDDEEFDSGRSAVRIASVAALGGLLFGYDSAVINGAVKSIQQHFEIGDKSLGIAVASALLGAAVGAMTAGRLADRIGRLAVMKLAALLFLISALGAGVAWNIWVLVGFRVIGGLGVGIASVIAPAYIAETSPASIRGRLGSLQQLAIVSGIFLSLAVDALLAHLAGGAGSMLWLGLEAWRWMFILMAIPAVVYGLLAFTIPESPRYLVATHRIPEARTVLTTLLGEKNLEITIDRIQQTLDTEQKPSWRDMCKPGGGPLSFYGIVWVGLALSVFQQFVGINVIFYYGETLWKLAGVSEKAALERNIISGVVSIAACFITMALVDKVGRKPLLLVGSAGMTLALGAMSWAFSQGTLDAAGALQMDPSLGMIAVIAANIYVIFFNVSWGPVMWVMLGEMFPNQLRGSALAVCGLAQWGANYAVVQSFPAMASGLGLAETYVLYTVSAAVSFWLVKAFLPETKGKELEQMEGWGGH